MGVYNIQKIVSIGTCQHQRDFSDIVRTLLIDYQSNTYLIINKIEEKGVSSDELQKPIEEYIKCCKQVLAMPSIFGQVLSVPQEQTILNIHVPIVQGQQFPTINNDQINHLLLETDLNQVHENMNVQADHISELFTSEIINIPDILTDGLNLIRNASTLGKLYSDEIQQFLINLSLQTEDFINSQIEELLKANTESRNAFQECFINFFKIHVKTQIYHLLNLVNYQLTYFNSFVHYSASSFSQLTNFLENQFHLYQQQQTLLFKETLRQHLELNSKSITNLNCHDEVFE